MLKMALAAFLGFALGYGDRGVILRKRHIKRGGGIWPSTRSNPPERPFRLLDSPCLKAAMVSASHRL